MLSFESIHAFFQINLKTVLIYRTNCIAVKMKLIKLLVIFVFLCVLLQVQTQIIIDIEPDEIPRFSEILVEKYLEQVILNATPQKNIAYLCKKASIAIIQLIGIMFTLVGANVLTEMINIAGKQQQQQQQYIPIIDNVTDSLPTEKCVNDFGCNRNMCWRTCNVESTDNEMFSWCFTKPPSKNVNNVQSCTDAKDCSPCWSCFSQCHTIPKV